MSHEKVKDGYSFGCDCCSEVWNPPRLGIGSHVPEFVDCWEGAKEAGWRAFKNKKGKWETRCPDCK